MGHSLTNKRFITQLAHDMRSPLAVLKSFLQNIDVGADQPDLFELKEAALRSINKLQYLIEMLNAPVSSICPRRQWVDIAELIRLSIKELRTITGSQDIDIIYIGETHLFAFVDPFLINRILINFIINALQALERESGTIRIGLFRQDDTIHMEVSDNGCGIKEAHLSRIFDAGFTAGKKNGTGMGLGICRQIAEAHDGKIEVYSVSKRGTVFTTTLPYSTDSIFISEEYGTRWQEATLD